jgi:hypothetical protein
MPKFLALAFERAHPAPQSYVDAHQVWCGFCETAIEDRAKGLQLKYCNHHIHKSCLEDVFREKNECPVCKEKLTKGYDVCTALPKAKVNKVIQKKKQVDKEVNDILARTKAQ